MFEEEVGLINDLEDSNGRPEAGQTQADPERISISDEKSSPSIPIALA